MNKIINNAELKWLFISGKGGVGKTTLSSSIAIELSKYRKKVLLLSIDPAHSTSDIFKQKFSIYPTLINGYTNLYCMEYNILDYNKNIDTSILNSKITNFNTIINLFKNISGIDEAYGYISLLKKISELDYSIIIFDTAPTGYTLKLISYPNLLKESYKNLLNSVLGNIFKNLLLNIVDDNENSIDEINGKIDIINNKLLDPLYTQFICITTPEYLSVYEMERFIQKLIYQNLECNTIIVNKIIQEPKCKSCENICKNQDKYLDIIDELYSDDFNIIHIPLFDDYNIISKYLYNSVEYTE